VSFKYGRGRQKSAVSKICLVLASIGVERGHKPMYVGSP
jgi:hypothetical protein